MHMPVYIYIDMWPYFSLDPPLGNSTAEAQIVRLQCTETGLASSRRSRSNVRFGITLNPKLVIGDG